MCAFTHNTWNMHGQYNNTMITVAVSVGRKPAWNRQIYLYRPHLFLYKDDSL
jgi:hypothetical protein